MNLGAFMDPEFPIFSTTLCYLEREDAYLMLHRIKKQDDYNHDKWVGVGGKFERFESPEDCLVREVREETGVEASVLAPLGRVRYYFTVHEPEGPVTVSKEVHYFLMRHLGGTPRPQLTEVENAFFLPASEALERLSYPNEREMLKRALLRLRARAKKG